MGVLGQFLNVSPKIMVMTGPTGMCSFVCIHMYLKEGLFVCKPNLSRSILLKENYVQERKGKLQSLKQKTA